MTKTEAQTRQEMIDVQLQAAGWDVNDTSQVAIEFDIKVDLPEDIREPRTEYEGHQFSDYVLLGKDGKPLAVVEAKKSSKDAAIGREQAKQYCHNIQKQNGGELPFCFYTNGHEIFFWDLDNVPPKKVHGYPTRADLERLSYIRSHKKPLAHELINTDIAGRDYQIQAIRTVMEAIEKKQQRSLLVMATGTGKTRTCIALVDALMRAGWCEKVLFLVDRIALREQALEAFKEHLPNEPRWPKIGEKLIAKDRRIYVSTYPTMLNVVRDEQTTLSPHFFDLIVIDESHRSIYNTYQEVLDYFNATTLGLTATPTDVIDHNTFKLFNCNDGIPNFAYSYQDAVTNLPPYLCDFKVMKLQTRFQAEGISKRTISLEDQKKMMREGKEVAEINFEGKELEKTVTNKGTNARIVKEFMEECIKDPNGVLPGKTIFFCSSIAHARRIEAIFDQLYPEYGGELAKVMVSDDPRVYGRGGLLDQFTHKDRPRIAISVDMLDTGIDVRELVNLVFAKPVYSYTKFWQMIGRGTRLLEANKLKPWCPTKDTFLILDCWDNFEYFKLTPAGKENKATVPLPVRFFGLRLDKIEVAQKRGESAIAEKEIKALRVQIEQLPKNSVVIAEAKPELAKLAEENFWINLSQDKLTYLRDTIQPLFRTLSQVDFKAMRFCKDLLAISLAKLEEQQDKYTKQSTVLITLIGELPLSVNIVAQQEPLIREAQTTYYWNSATDDEFDHLAEKLAPLISFIEKGTGSPGQSKFDLTDPLHNKEMVEFGPQHEAMSTARYRELLEKTIMALTEQNPVLQKIKAGQVIDQGETDALAELLNNEHPHITEELLRKVYQNRKARFIQFIKHILGTEVLENYPQSVSNAFADFIRQHSDLSSKQLEFLNLLKSYMIERGEIHKRNLIEAPFTLLHPQGIRGIFTPAEINEILLLTEKLAA